MSDKKAAKGRDKQHAATLPVLLNFSFSAAQLLVLFVGVVTTALSFLSGAPLWVVAVRGGAAMVSVGLVFWLVSWMIAKDTLEVAGQEALREMEAARQKAAEAAEANGSSTVEIRA
jgi:hypothetical protein